MNTTYRWNARLLFLVFMAGASCGGDGLVAPPDPPDTADPGALAIQVDRAAANTGAVILVVSGGPIQQGFLATGLTGRVVKASPTEIRMLVRGSIGLGIVGLIQVPDRRVAYSTQLLEAAANKAGGYQVLDPSQFGLKLVKP